MRVTQVVPLLCVSLGTVAFGGDSSQKGLRLTQHPISLDSVDPGLLGWAAVLHNGTVRPRPIEVFRNPGGYAGSGAFYPCRLERWDAPSRRWVSLRDTPRADFGVRSPQEEQIASGGSLEVCTVGVPSQEVGPFACLRFALRFAWSNGGEEVYSEPFASSGVPASGPCAARAPKDPASRSQDPESERSTEDSESSP